ncbi:MAG: hypothetical protein ABIZ36_03765 [Gemmatimonadaceae bacterium]
MKIRGRANSTKRALLRFALVAGFLFAAPLYAQNSYGIGLATGTQIRVRTTADPQTRITGKVIAVAGDTILVAIDHSQASYRLDRILLLEARGGKDRKRGMAIGAGVLGGIGLVFGGIDASRGKISGGDFAGTVIVNAAIGALLGYALAPKGWEAVPLVRR